MATMPSRPVKSVQLLLRAVFVERGFMFSGPLAYPIWVVAARKGQNTSAPSRGTFSGIYNLSFPI